jgi:asparagine synthase (glutamine-hydrolysing)
VRYWTPSFDETGGGSIRELGGELKARVRAQVERLADRPAAGAFLSGGLDSSTVAGMLAAARPGAARTYSIGFPAEGYDELRYARIAATHFGTIQREYQVTPEDAVAAIAQVAAGCDEPFGNSSALAVYFCARLARQDGIELLLGGDGGDEIFAGNTRYAKQGIFEAYARVPSALRHHLIQPLLAVPGMDRLPLVRKAHSYVRQARVPLPDRLDSYNFLHRHAADEIFDPDFLRTVDVDQPLREVRETYRTPEHASPLNRMLYLDWKRTLQDNDLVKVNRMCQLAGVDVAYPMLDDAVVELSCRVPSRLKLRPGRIRHFYKEAMRDFLPPEIIRKRKHGFGLPFGVWTRSHPQLQELAYGSVAALEHHGFFRPDFLHRAVALHRSDTPEYYGELVWILMMLRLWLDGGSGGPARPGG